MLDPRILSKIRPLSWTRIKGRKLLFIQRIPLPLWPSSSRRALLSVSQIEGRAFSLTCNDWLSESTLVCYLTYIDCSVLDLTGLRGIRVLVILRDPKCSWLLKTGVWVGQLCADLPFGWLPFKDFWKGDSQTKGWNLDFLVSPKPFDFAGKS